MNVLLAVLWKDLVTEWRGRDRAVATLLFSLLVVVWHKGNWLRSDCRDFYSGYTKGRSVALGEKRSCERLRHCLSQPL